MTAASDHERSAAAPPTQLELGLNEPGTEHQEIRDLLKAFTEGKVNDDQIVSRLMVLYQTGIGSAVNGLAELDKHVAQQLGERIRQRIEGFLRELDARGSIPKSSSKLMSADERLRNKSSAVLQREYALFEALTKTNQEIPSASLVAKIRSFDPDIPDATLTAHLDRLFKGGLVARERKGLYRGTPRSKSYLDALISELEARGISLPALVR